MRWWIILGLLAPCCTTGAAKAQTPGSLSGTNLVLSSVDLSKSTAIASGGTNALTLANKLTLFLGPDDFGAAGNGTTNDLTALISGGSVHRLGVGTYYAAESVVSLPAGRWYSGGGQGRLAFCQGGTGTSCTGGTITLSAPNMAMINSAPATYAGYDGSWIGGAFAGDLTGIHLTAGTVISGAATLGTPTSSYQLNPLASMIFLALHNTSGHNDSTSGNTGRTGVAQIFLRSTNAGEGDTSGLFYNGFVTGTQATATSFLANAATSIVGGQVFAGADGVYLQGLGDINLNDNGHDVAGIGLVINAVRSNVTGALGATWMMIRPQSQGSAPIDAFYSAGGPSRIGIDFTGMVLHNLDGSASNAAMTTKAGMMWFGNANNTDTTRYAKYTTTGTETFGYSATTGWTASVGGTPIFEATSAGVTATALRISAPTVPSSSSDACSTGQVAYDASYAYFCVATNTWKRASLSTW